MHSVELSPLTGNLGPFPHIGPLPHYGLPAGLPPFVAGYTTRLTTYIQDLDSRCCETFWHYDTDGDGTFDDQRDFAPGVAGTLVLAGGDDTEGARVRQTFPVAGPDQAVGQGEDEEVQRTRPSDPRPTPPTPVPKQDPKSSLRLAITSVTQSSRGISLRTTCSAACRTTIVVRARFPGRSCAGPARPAPCRSRSRPRSAGSSPGRAVAS